MVCYSPLSGWRSRTVEQSGKRRIVFNRREGYGDLPVHLPCGGCVGCRLERSRQWAIRCAHEASLYYSNCFVTLTYRDSSIPPLGSLDKSHFQLFMKRLRKKYSSSKIRYYMCGEYGDSLLRPHYHACLFNFDFKDKVFFKENNGVKIYVSPELEKIWKLGFCTIGEVNFKSAGYVARYVMKKQNGEKADKHYRVIDPETGEILGYRLPEYTDMSRRPGIGQPWLDKYQKDVYPSDFIVINGKKMRVPRYYDQQLVKADGKYFAELRGCRVRKAREHSEDNTPDRLKVREKCQEARLQQLPRELESEK